MTPGAPFDIIGLIRSKVKDGESSPTKAKSSSYSKRNRKTVQRIGAVTELGDEFLWDGEEDFLNDSSSDVDFTVGSKKVSCICKATRRRKTFIMRCYTCKGNFHGDCIRIDSSYYKAFSLAGDIWLCPICASLDTGKDVEFFMSKEKNTSSTSTKSSNKEEEVDSKCATQPVITIADNTSPPQDLSLGVVNYSENEILERLSSPLPPDTTHYGDYYLFSNPDYVPELKECISLIKKAKKKEFPLSYSPPQKSDIKGGYIYVFKSDNDLLENTTNEGEWSFGDGFIFSNIVIKKFNISSSEISIVERLESNSSIGFKRRAVWLTSDTSIIVVGYIGSVGSITEDKSDLDLVIYDNNKQTEDKDKDPSSNNYSIVEDKNSSQAKNNISIVIKKSVTPVKANKDPSGHKTPSKAKKRSSDDNVTPSKANEKLLSLLPGISVIPQSTQKDGNITPKKSAIEVVDLSSDENDTHRKETPRSSTKKRKKQFTPKRVMPNLPPKQCEYLKYRKKLNVEGTNEDSESKDRLTITHVQSLADR